MESENDFSLYPDEDPKEASTRFASRGLEALRNCVGRSFCVFEQSVLCRSLVVRVAMYQVHLSFAIVLDAEWV